MAEDKDKPAATTPTKRAKSTRKTASPQKAKPATKRTRSTKAKATTKPATTKPEPKADAQKAHPQPSATKKTNAVKEEAEWGHVLWQFAGILFFTGLSAIALAVLASLGLANLVLKLIQAEQNSLKNWQAWVHSWLNDALFYIAQPQGELPFPFRPATPPNQKS